MTVYILVVVDQLKANQKDKTVGIIFDGYYFFKWIMDSLDLYYTLVETRISMSDIDI